MALKKAVTTPQGVVAEYWKIVDYKENFLNNTATCVVALFVNADIAHSGAYPCNTFEYSCSLDSIITLEARESVYPLLKGVGQRLEGAEDC